MAELCFGDTVIMDNISSHARVALKEMIGAPGSTMRCLSHHSLDFNPIEKAFPRPKAMLRNAGERAVRGILGPIGRLVDILQPKEGIN